MPARKYTEQQRLAFLALIDRGGSVRGGPGEREESENRVGARQRIPLARVEQVIDPGYLSLLERERLKDLMTSGLSIRKIAARWGGRLRPSAVTCDATP